MSQIKTLFKNMSWLTLSQVITNLCAFLWTIIIARYLGVSSYGLLSFLISFTILIGIGEDLGITTFTTRELARDKTNTKKFINNIFPIKFTLSIVLLIVTISFLYLLNYNQLTIELTFIIFIETIFISLYNFLSGVFQAHENLKPGSNNLLDYS